MAKPLLAWKPFADLARSVGAPASTRSPIRDPAHVPTQQEPCITICVGLVLFMDPDTLLENGAWSNRSLGSRVRGPHAFVCVEHVARQKIGVWHPTFSSPGRDRRLIQPSNKKGDQWWMGSSSFVDQTQRWTVPDPAVVIATSGEIQQFSLRNRVISVGLLFKK